MKLRFVWVGKTRNAALRQLIDDYLGRIGRYARVEIVEVRDAEGAGSDPRRVIEKEGEALLAEVRSDSFVVVLDERGPEMTSAELARFVEEHQLAGAKQVTFVIGGHAGLSDSVRRRADHLLALSRMTLTHEFARVLLAEQMYRAFAILKDLPYQK